MKQTPADACRVIARAFALVGVIVFCGAWMPRAIAQDDDLPGSIPATAIRVLDAEERAYASLGIPNDARVNPEAKTRLLILRDGRLLIDYGLKHSVSSVPKPGGGRWQEEVVERVEVAGDESSAILQRYLFRGVPNGEGEGSPEDSPFRRLAEVDLLSTELVWIDADHPEGLWSVTLEADRWLKNMLILPQRQGVALSTTMGNTGGADLRLYGGFGREILTLSEIEASVTRLDATLDGTFLLVDLAYPARADLPDRGVRIFNMPTGSHWTYTWSYGQPNEPVSYEMLETGALQVRLPGEIHIYDPSGNLVEVRTPGT